MNQIATVQQLDARRSVTVAMAERFGMEPAAFEATVRATCMPPGKDKEITREQFAAFLLVCKQYDLNPILKEIYAFPTRSGGIQPVVGVDGWASLINRQPACDGVEFEDHLDDNGGLTAITCQIFRKDRKHATTATEYMAECKRATDTWKQWPRRMLRHKALIQAARYAFGFSGIVEPDEWERSPENPEATAPKKPATVVQAPANGQTKPLPPVVGQTSEEALAALPVEDSAKLLKALLARLVKTQSLASLDKWAKETADARKTLTDADRAVLDEGEDHHRNALTPPDDEAAEDELAPADG